MFNKKIYITFLAILFLGIFTFSALITSAADPTKPTPGTIPTNANLGIDGSATANITTTEGLWSILASVVQYVYTAFFMVAVLFILFAAYTYVTSKGDPKAIATATQSITWAAVAIVVALLSVGANLIVKSLIPAV